MATSTNHRSFTNTKRIAASFTVAVIFLAWGPLLPARGQCNPQELAKLIASDAAASDFFGISVAMSGDTAVVGASFGDNPGGSNAGSAYVFIRIGTIWTEQAKLIASDAAASDAFGTSVAVSGDTAVIGAYQDDDGGSSSGSAYVYVRSGGVWTQQAKLTAADAAANDYFGYSVAVSGDTAVVGAYLDDRPNPVGADAGAAYVFVRTGGVWTQQAKLTAASDAAAGDQFGYSVAVSGDTALVGSIHDTHQGGADAGSAYVFIRAGGVWTQQAKLTASDAAAGDLFGCSVAVSGDTGVVGADSDDDAGTSTGSAYVFVRTGGVWTQQAKLIASEAAAGDLFGGSVAMSGNTAVVGARGENYAGAIDLGSAYVFVRTGGIWIEQARLTASDAAAGDNFGISAAVSGDSALVGAYLDDHAGGISAGSAYSFSLDFSDDDGDGVANACDVCPNNSPGLSVDSTGRPHLDRNGDCLVDGADIQLIVDEMLNP